MTATTKIDIIAYSIFSFMVGILVCGIVLRWDVIADTFLNVRITELFQIAITLIIGCFIAYQLSVKSSKLIKRSEIFLDFFNIMQDKVISIYSNGRKYMSKPNSSAAKLIVGELRNLSIQITLLERMIANKKLDIEISIEDIKINYLMLKSIVTGNDFYNQFAKYTDKEMMDFDNTYEKIMNNIFEAKIALYK
jgi:hypothetical protein